MLMSLTITISTTNSNNSTNNKKLSSSSNNNNNTRQQQQQIKQRKRQHCHLQQPKAMNKQQVAKIVNVLTATTLTANSKNDS